MLCRLHRSRPCPPVMADLPEARLGYEAPPFIHSGVDYFGPIQVRHSRKTEKRYGVLFTCLTTRAVHVEVAHSLDADSCIMAIRRMIARRGKPVHLWSDRGITLSAQIKRSVKLSRGGISRKLKTNSAKKGYSGTSTHQHRPILVEHGNAWSSQRRKR